MVLLWFGLVLVVLGSCLLSVVGGCVTVSGGFGDFAWLVFL